MRRLLVKALLATVPALLALCAVLLEGSVRTWAQGRGAALPLIMLLIGTSLLNPKLRKQIIPALCYGVAFLAIRDTYQIEVWLGTGHGHWIRTGSSFASVLDTDTLETVVLSALLLIVALSIIAAIAETIRPDTVWARRCYFGAAALYFNGLGISCYGPHGSWQAVVLCLTGITAVFGCIFAHRIVAAESWEEPETEYSDESEQKLRDAEHLRALRDKEWQDPSASQPVNAGNVSRTS